MKCSEYLWTRLDFMKMNPGMNPEQVTGELEIMLTNNNDEIYSNTTGERMEADEALSVLGRADGKGENNRLLQAYRNGQKALFELLVTKQNMSDDEWEESQKLDEEAIVARIAEATAKQ